MKFKTRLTLCIVLLLAAALAFTSWKNISSCHKILLEDAIASSQEEAAEFTENIYWNLLYELDTEYQLDTQYQLYEQYKLDTQYQTDSQYERNNQYASDNPSNLGPAELALLNYQFGKLATKNNRTEVYVLQQENEMLYNNSGVNAHAALLQAYPELTELKDTQSELLSCTISLQQKDYCIWGKIYRIQDQNYTVALVYDITRHLSPIRQITIRCIQIGLLVTILTAILVICLLNHMLRPIKILQEKAAEISRGNYHARIPLKTTNKTNRQNPINNRKDELTSLSLSFNEMAQAVECHMKEIENQSEQRKMLLSALNHEMKTPVTSITGYSYVLLHSKLAEEQQKEALFYIDSECRRLERLSGKLNQLISLDYMQTETPEEKQHISAATLTQSIQQILTPIAEKYNILLHIKSEENACFVGDLDLYLMLITNLFDNARKASASMIQISIAPNCIAVKDNGNGIPQDKLAKVIQPFYQGDDSRNTEGFGLGLALCEKIARIHGANLKIESELGIGTTVMMLF